MLAEQRVDERRLAVVELAEHESRVEPLGLELGDPRRCGMSRARVIMPTALGELGDELLELAATISRLACFVMFEEGIMALHGNRDS